MAVQRKNRKKRLKIVSKNEVLIIGGGLAGCEAAMQIASRKVKARIIEMRPNKMTPVHKTGNLAELVCSNSLKSTNPVTANGISRSRERCDNNAVLPQPVGPMIITLDLSSSSSPLSCS